MASQARKCLEKWLKTIDVKGRVLDAGGLRLSVKGRTKSWEVEDYKILDIKGGDYRWNLNNKFTVVYKYDVVFCLEVMQFIYNPVVVLQNLSDFLEAGGKLYINFHFIFPVCKGTDYLRYTKLGIKRLMDKVGINIEEIIPRLEKNKEVGYFIYGRKR